MGVDRIESGCYYGGNTVGTVGFTYSHHPRGPERCGDLFQSKLRTSVQLTPPEPLANHATYSLTFTPDAEVHMCFCSDCAAWSQGNPREFWDYLVTLLRNYIKPPEVEKQA